MDLERERALATLAGLHVLKLPSAVLPSGPQPNTRLVLTRLFRLDWPQSLLQPPSEG